MVDVIKDIEKAVEKGTEVVEELVEKVEEAITPNQVGLKEGVPSSNKKKDINEEGKETPKKVKKKKSVVVNKKELKGKDAKKSKISSATKSKEEQDLVGLEKAAEAESTEKTIEEKKKAILEKAAKLKEKIDQPKTEELKEQIKEKKKKDSLVEIDDYVKAGIYLGTKVVTPDMRPFVYRRRADGLAIFDTNIIDDKLREAVEYLAKFEPKDIIVVCKRPAGWKAVNKFSELTGILAFTKKYPAGILTNITLPDFFENELTIVCDSWLDKNALFDTKKINKKVLMICDTNNFAKGADQIIIGNNKSPKSLGIIFYLLAREYCKAKKIECAIPDMDWWMIEED